MLIITLPPTPINALHALRAFAAAAAPHAFRCEWSGGIVPKRLRTALGRTHDREHPPLAVDDRHIWSWATALVDQSNADTGSANKFSKDDKLPQTLVWGVRGPHPYDIKVSFAPSEIVLTVDRPHSVEPCDKPGFYALHSDPSDRQMAAIEELPDSLLDYVPNWARPEVDVRFPVTSATTAAEIWLAVVNGMDSSDRCNVSCTYPYASPSCWIVVERCTPDAPVLRWIGADLAARKLPVTISPVYSTSESGYELRLTPSEIAEIVSGE